MMFPCSSGQQQWSWWWTCPPCTFSATTLSPAGNFPHPARFVCDQHTGLPVPALPRESAAACLACGFTVARGRMYCALDCRADRGVLIAGGSSRTRRTAPCSSFSRVSLGPAVWLPPAHRAEPRCILLVAPHGACRRPWLCHMDRVWRPRTRTHARRGWQVPGAPAEVNWER